MADSRGRSSRSPQILVGFGVSVALIVWLIWAIEWPKVWTALLTVHYVYLIPATALIAAHFVVRGLRWRLLLPNSTGGERVPLPVLVDAILVGAFATFILPLRAGEFVRPLLLSRRSEYSFGTAFASVVIERFFDLAMVLVSFGLMLPHVPGVPAWVERGAQILTILAVGLFFFLCVGSVWTAGVVRFVDKCLAFAPAVAAAPLRKFVVGLLQGTVVLKSPRRLGGILLLTALVWGSSYALCGLYLWLFDIPASAAFSVAIGVIIALAVAAPSAPGFIGVYQTACVAAFALFGLNQEEAIAYSLVSHAHQYLFFVLYGITSMMRHNISLRDLQGARSS